MSHPVLLPTHRVRPSPARVTVNTVKAEDTEAAQDTAHTLGEHQVLGAYVSLLLGFLCRGHEANCVCVLNVLQQASACAQTTFRIVAGSDAAHSILAVTMGGGRRFARGFSQHEHLLF
eukprot:5041282-Pleurochrysis_carterae.AAC.1